ncbi:hypothetical protein L6452_05152 [Arctium lappa]|uniref:Uncharacterized protein n=1 Tax=Arctium lappa TaxID=4217 RepID=A0ACB9EG17_ARCLA|nr:hypothetical protein L6452_05152 [Arctium lappa]
MECLCHWREWDGVSYRGLEEIRWDDDDDRGKRMIRLEAHEVDSGIDAYGMNLAEEVVRNQKLSRSGWFRGLSGQGNG